MHKLHLVSFVLLTLFFLGYSEEQNIVKCSVDVGTKIAIKNGVVSFLGATELCSEADRPSLPLITKRFLLPENAKLSSVSVDLKSATEEVVATDCKVNLTTIFTTDENGKSVKIASKIDTLDIYPKSTLFNLSTGKLGLYKIVTVTLSPFRYNRVKKLLLASKKIDLSVKYLTDKSVRITRRPFPSNRNRVKNIVDNFNQASKTYGEPSRSSYAGHYLILTSSTIKSQLSKLDLFVSSKKAQGFKVSVLTEDSWGGTATNGDVHQVRNWLKSNYETEGYTHLLIIDNPADGAIPMLVATPDFSDRYKPLVDMYYADLSGDWDIDGDGKYGVFGSFNSKDFDVGGVDQFEEVFVGRIPYYGSAATTDKILNRIVEYSKEKASSASWRKRLYMPMSDFGPGFGDGAKYGSVIKSNVINSSDWSVTEIYGTACNRPEVIKTWNECEPGLVVWQAHGLYNYAENLMYSNEATVLKVPTHTYQTSCHTGKPENPDNLAFAVLKSGAISTIGAAVQCLYSSNKSTWGVSGGARDYGYFYAKNMILEKKPAGEAVAASRADLKVQFSTNWLNCVETNLYGCPAVGPYTTDINPDNVEIITSKKSSIKTSIKTLYSRKKLTISTSEKLLGGTVTLFSLNGKKVKEVLVKSGSKNLVIKTNSLSNGIYFAEIKIKTLKNINTKKIQFTVTD